MNTDFTKIIDLHYGQSPVRGDTLEMQQCLDKETEFCAVYVNNGIPVEVHNRTNDRMMSLFGVFSQFAKEHGSYIRPYLVNIGTGSATVGIINANADTLRGSPFRVGGTFFSTNIARYVLEEFRELGYQINKKYE
jgi:hypothetical protein